jgi:hypothetical protein
MLNEKANPEELDEEDQDSAELDEEGQASAELDEKDSAELDEEDKKVEEFDWQQRGLIHEVTRAISAVKVPERWVLPEPPDKGLITTVHELMTAASALGAYLQKVLDEWPEESAKGHKEESGDESHSHQPELVGAD